jgi:acyl-coenzyme A thioesterase 13
MGVAGVAVAVAGEGEGEGEGEGKGKGRGKGKRANALFFSEWTNIVGAMHGAAAGWLVDTCTTAALVSLSTPTFWGPPMIGGVSLTLDMSYFNPAPEGIKLRIVVTVERLSPTLANTRCDVSSRYSV